MKKIFTIVAVTFVSIVSFNSMAQSVSLPQAILSETPLGTVENNGNGVATISFVESSGTIVPGEAFGEPNVSISVDLNYVELSDFDVNALTGDLLGYFTASYDEATNILLLKQSNDIPGDWTGSVQFPIDVTQNSSQPESFNGFNANISAIDGSTNAEGNASIFTYTDPNVLAVETLDALLFEILPNPTKGELTILLENNGETKVELFDLLGKMVITKTYNNLDTISLNIEHISSATYVLKVTTGGLTNSVQIVKE